MDEMEPCWTVYGTKACWVVDGTDACWMVGGVEIGEGMDEMETCRALDAICCEIWARIATDCCW